MRSTAIFMKFADAREGHPYDVAVDIIINQRRRPETLHFALCTLHLKLAMGQNAFDSLQTNISDSLNYNF